MYRNKLVLGLAFMLVLGLCVYLGASDRDHSFQHNPNPMNRLHSAPKEAKPPLPPNFELPGEVKKPCQTLAAAGTGFIRGRVTQVSGGDPIEGVTIYVDRLGCPEYYGTGYSESDGYYVIRDLPAGKYQAYTSNDSIYVDIYWDNKPVWGTPDTLVVVSDDTTEDINFNLRVGGTITGMVTKPGELFGTTTVYATDTMWNIYYSGDANILSGSGSYEIKQLPTGIYKVNTANYDSFVNEYYNDKPDWATANPVRVKEDSTTTSINFTLALGGKITGTVTLTGASSVTAYVYATNTTTEGWYFGLASGSGSSAAYEINGLPTGTYKVDTWNFQGYLDEYWDDKPDWASADPVAVTQGITTSGKDFTLTLGGIIKGNISSTAKGPLKSIPVYALSTTNPFWVEGFGNSDVAGNYRIPGLRSGYYKIFIYGDTTYAFEFRKNKSTFGSADSVLVTASDSVLNVDDSLEVGGSISGYVYGEGGVPDSNANVTAYHVTEYWSSKGDHTSPDGSYKVGGLRTGWYRVSAYIECDQMYYDHKSVWEQPDSVYVTMPGNISGVNFNFPSAVEDEENQNASRPAEFELSQNYPNPFNPGTAIEYTVQKKAQVNLEIYNLLGQKVKTLLNENQSAGAYHILWDGKNEQSQTVASGVYFYRLKVNGAVQTKRMVLLR